jgi:hypothetical protein
MTSSFRGDNRECHSIKNVLLGGRLLKLNVAQGVPKRNYWDV